MLEYGDIALHAKDLPHSIQDVLNDLPEFARKIPGQLRHIFEQVIATNTAGDEPNAPPIQIINTVDEVECPPYEFYYTNRMWYGETVSKPDVSKLKGCDCYPTCKANPKGCSCLKKQEKFYDSGMSGFAYNKHRRLQYGEYPVFECNSKCNCCHDCPNRVVQHGREHAINIKMTEHKGWGVFAAVRIPKNTFIGIYAGEFLTDTEGERRGKVYNSGSRTYLFDIDFWHLRQDNEDWTTKYCVDAWHAGNNHSCEPNCFIVPVYINEPDLEKPLLAIFTNRDVPAHQELCFSYFGPPDQDDQGSEPDVDSLRQGELFTRCQCGTKSCTGRMWR
ncbi:SET domain-containing protein [Trametopsis cervina]|nr:SET domain-containing protein [Trametopsis cervina]